jgi:mono/diheme cytochrome c family protein
VRRLRNTIATVTTVALAGASLTACGTEGVSVSDPDSEAGKGAEIFAEHCAGCHTLSPAGTQGSGMRTLRVQGPNLDQRHVAYEDALYAIRNGGASGAVMPQNIVVGENAEAVARFIDEYSGQDSEESPAPGNSAEGQS